MVVRRKIPLTFVKATPVKEEPLQSTGPADAAVEQQSSAVASTTIPGSAAVEEKPSSAGPVAVPESASTSESRRAQELKGRLQNAEQ